MNLSVRFTHPHEHTLRFRCSRCDPRRLRALASALRRNARRDRVCTQVYGGPDRAVVTGTLRGERVSARFSRVDGCAIADYDALVRALGGTDPRHVAVPERDSSPPTATIVLATPDGRRTLAGHGVELPSPRLRGTALAEDRDGGVARVRVSIKERITCRAADGVPFERSRTRYFPPPQIERIVATPGTRLPTARKRSLRLTLGGERCGPDAQPVEVHGELWGEAINGAGLEAVTPHIRFVYRR